MNSPALLLFGKNGQVGWELCRALAPLGRVLAMDRAEADLADEAALRRIVREAQPRVIINAAAYTAVDKAESETDLARRVNGIAPGALAEAARETGAWLIHFSTDYVYDGAKTTPYVETDSTNPLNVYGRTKLEGDQAVIAAGGKHLIFRTSWVYGNRGRNFFLTIQRLARGGKSLRIVNDQLGSPTWSRVIAEATTQAVRRVLAAEDASPSGVYHLAAEGFTSWHGFASRIVECMPDAHDASGVQPITTAEYPTPAKRPRYSVLDCGKLKRTFGVELPNWEASLRMVARESAE